MALLQISEPGMAPAPHQRKLAIGIDLGTTNSLVASIINSIPTVIEDSAGQQILPSAVNYAKDGFIVGQSALERASEDPENTLLSIKRLMGRTADKVLTLNDQSAYRFAQTSRSVPAIITAAGDKTAVEVSSDILKALLERAKQRFNEDIEGAVITVPAYFDDAQRQATKDAAILAGIPVLRLLNEPTAAAIAYGLDQVDDATLAIYDLGGGTFDITLLKFSKGVFEVLATGGDSSLGGDDIDHAIAEWIIAQAKITDIDASYFRQVMTAARQGKEALSDTEVVSIELSMVDIDLSLSREQLAKIAAPLINRTVEACKNALFDAQLEKPAIDNVVMVGGSTRLLSVRESMSSFFDQPVLTDIDPDTVVALGAAIQADILVGNKPDADLLLLDVIPLSLGLETMGGLVERVIHRNTTIPVAKAQEFTTSKDGQTAMSIHVLQGERDLVEDCRSLARFELQGIPAMVAGAAHIRVTFQVDADGLLSVSAKELGTGIESAIQVKPSYGLTDEEITEMLNASFEHAGIDKDARVLREQQVDAERLLNALEEAIAVDGEALLTAEEQNHLQSAMSELSILIKGTDADVIKEQTTAVSVLSENFAAKRMDMAIKKALAGHSLDEFEE